MTQSNTSKRRKSSTNNINKPEYQINRGIELIISGGKKKRLKPFHVVFDKIVCFFNREVTIHFEFSLSSKKITK